MSVLLLVEDDEAERYVLRKAVARLGHEAVVATDGEIALMALQNDRGITALVTDIGLGSGMSGIALAHAALALRPRLKLLFITGRALEDLPPMPGPLLRKPYPEDALLRAFEALFEEA